MSSKKQIKFEIDGIGPHYNDNKISSVIDCDKLRVAVFAKNGIGKSTISRMFSLADDKKIDGLVVKDYCSNGKKKGKFKFVVDEDSKERIFEVEIKNDESDPLIDNKSDYIFHTFNSDYVQNNIVPNNYNYGGNPEGYIVGKDAIELTNEREELTNEKNELTAIKENLDLELKKTFDKLDDLRISKNTTEYKKIDFFNLTNKEYNEEEELFGDLEARYRKLSKVSSFEDIVALKHSVQTEFLDDIEKVLSESYKRVDISEEYIQILRKENEFFSKGVELYNEEKTKCPFCMRDTNEDMIEVIRLYEKYIEDEESKINSKLVKFKENLDRLKSELSSHHSTFSTSVFKTQSSKMCFSEFEKVESPPLNNPSEINIYLEEIGKLIENKKKDISNRLDSSDCISQCKEYLKTLNEAYDEQNKLIDSLNQVQRNKGDEEKALRRKLCNSAFTYLIRQEDVNIDAYNKSAEIIKELEEIIKDKSTKNKTDRRQMVISTLEHLLEKFFGDKYSFDEENYNIKFKGSTMGERTSRILSDGEKNIVAFCYYLADVYMIVKEESDREKLFFIIDDPVSSVDFDFTYAMCQIIRNLDKEFDITTGLKFIIFTHNIYFFNILVDNGIVKTALHLIPGEIIKMNKTPILPYEYHLIDIIEVSEGRRDPKPTTPNSIRQVLETLQRFECPGSQLNEFIESKKEFQVHEMYLLINDMSHGGYSKEFAMFEEDIVKCCKQVYSFISKHYLGQIECVGKCMKKI